MPIDSYKTSHLSNPHTGSRSVAASQVQKSGVVMAKRPRARRARGVRRRAPVRRRVRSKVKGRRGRRVLMDGALAGAIRDTAVRAGADAAVRLGKRTRAAFANQRYARRMGPAGGVRRSRKYNIAPGRFIGPFKKPGVPKKVDKYALYGSRISAEFYGTVTHTDCAYIGMLSAHIRYIGTQVGIALIRRIMKQHYQVEYSDPNQQIMGTLGGNLPNAPVTINFRAEDSQTVTPTVAAAVTFTVGTNTLKQFGEWFSANVFSAAAFNHHQTTTGQYSHLVGYTIGYTDAGVVGNLVTQLYQLDNVKLHVYEHAKLLIQNTTPSDNGSRDGDSIDANPIQGNLLKFSQLLPDIKDGYDGFSFSALESDSAAAAPQLGDSIIIPTTNPTNTWRGVPGPEVFKNCVGRSKVNLQPGEIKYYKLRFNYVGNIVDLMKGLYFGTDRAARSANAVYNRMGTSMLLCFEKAVRTGVSSDVVINWHLDRECGAYWGTKKKTVMRKDFDLTTYNVDPA